MKRLVAVIALVWSVTTLSGAAQPVNVKTDSNDIPQAGDILWYSGNQQGGQNIGEWAQPQSIPGLQGEKGDKGDQGEQGIQGIQGIQGEQGIQGLQGEQGIQGVQGETGFVGKLSANSGADGESNNMSHVDVVGQGVTVTENGNVATLDLSNLQTNQSIQTADGLAQEVIDRTNGDANLQSQVNNEAAVRSATDNALFNGLNNEAVTRANADSALGSAIGAETARATSAEGALGSAINNETFRAQSAEASLGAGLNSEAATRATADTALQNNINNVNSNSVARDNVLQSNINNEASARAAGDAALQNQVNTINARAADHERRIDRLEETKYLLEPTVRLYDSKRFQVQVFDSYDVRHGMNFALGARIMLKLGKSYEEKLIERQNRDTARLLAANVGDEIADRKAIAEQLRLDKQLLADQAALLAAQQKALNEANARLLALEGVSKSSVDVTLGE